MHRLSPRLNSQTADRFAGLALDCIDREYPNHILHLLESDADAKPPRELTPVFFGCFDWHSAVHSHWSLVRLMRFFPEADWADSARTALSSHFTEDRIQGERTYLECPQRSGFERPYGLAWLLQLAAECREFADSDSQLWSESLYPLESLAWERFEGWLPKLTHPVRSGEHSQTAFAMALVYDWAASTENQAMLTLIENRSREFYFNDRNAPISYEPSGQDFLSPALAEADLMRRILPTEEFADWFERFLPDDSMHQGITNWLSPLTVSDPRDGKLAHLDGLNLSRAWMLEGIASSLADSHPRQSALLKLAEEHAAAGLAAVTGEHYAGGHWLGSFAVYLLTKRGRVKA